MSSAVAGSLQPTAEEVVLRIAVLGTGLMGAAIAEALLATGQQVVVYNRTAKKTKPLVALGAKAVATPAEAIAGSDASIIVVADAPALREVLLSDATRPALRDRKLLSATVTSPAEIVAIARDVRREGGHLAEGQVLALPEPVRRGQAQYLLGCGAAEESFWAGILQGTGVYLRRVGEVGDASKASLALTSSFILKTIATTYAAALATRMNIPPDLIQDQLTSNPELVISGAGDLLAQMFARKYTESMASVDIVLGGVALIIELARSVGMPTGVLDESLHLYRAASERGLSSKDLASVYEVLVEP